MNFFYTLFLVALSATPFLPTITAHSNKHYLPSETGFLRLLQKSAIPAYSGRHSIPTNMVYCPFCMDYALYPFQYALSDDGKVMLKALYLAGEDDIDFPTVRGPRGQTVMLDLVTVQVMPLNNKSATRLNELPADSGPVEIIDDALVTEWITKEEFAFFNISNYVDTRLYFLKPGNEAAVDRMVNSWITNTTRGIIKGNETHDTESGNFPIITSSIFFAKWAEEMKIERGDFITFNKKKERYVAKGVKVATHNGIFRGAKLWKSEKDNVQILSLPYADRTFRLNLIYPSDGDVPKFLKNLEEDKIDIEGIKKERHYKYNEICRYNISFPVFMIGSRVPMQEALDEFAITDVINQKFDSMLKGQTKQIQFKQNAAILVNKTGAAPVKRTTQLRGDTQLETVTAHVKTAFMFQIEYNNKIDSVILYQGIITDIIDAQKYMLH